MKMKITKEYEVIAEDRYFCNFHCPQMQKDIDGFVTCRVTREDLIPDKWDRRYSRCGECIDKAREVK